MQEEALGQIISIVYNIFNGQPPEAAFQQLTSTILQILESPEVLNDDSRIHLQETVENALREANLLKEVNL